MIKTYILLYKLKLARLHGANDVLARANVILCDSMCDTLLLLSHMTRENITLAFLYLGRASPRGLQDPASMHPQLKESFIGTPSFHHETLHDGTLDLS